MNRKRATLAAISALACLSLAGCGQGQNKAPAPANAPAQSGPENKQSMASTPKELIQILENASFLDADQYDKTLGELRGRYMTPLNLPIIPQVLDARTDPRKDIAAADIEAYSMKLVDFAKQSKADGNILWGRIQGTKYELMAHQWIRDELTRMGLKDVHYQEMHTQYPQWTPSRIHLEVSYSIPDKGKGTLVFDDAITAFISGTTPDNGVIGEVIYVGDGTRADLTGRNLAGKIVLLKANPAPGAMFNSARTAYSRLVTGEWGMPKGVILWWQIPGVRQVAGRVGAPGGADEIGAAVPWTGIGHSDGLYLRKILDRSSGTNPVTAKLVVQGALEPSERRTTANTWAVLPGQIDQYILIPSHVDGYFYGLHDNGAAVALNLALAKHYSALPLAKRRYGLIFMFQGDHEVPGVGGTLPFVRDNLEMMKNNLLLVLRPEHFGMTQVLDENVYISKSNISTPLILLVTNLNKPLIDIWRRAATNYSIPLGDFVYQDPAADEAAFHVPYNDIGAVSTGLIQTGLYYHTTADLDLGGVNFQTMEKMARAYGYVVDELSGLSKAAIHKAEAPDPATSIYSSKLLQMLMGIY